MEGIEHKTVVGANGVNFHIAEKGQGPLVLLLHGFPELWYSWRYQILHLAENGYRAVAPDLRGYGDTTGGLPVNDPRTFSIVHLVADIIGLLDAITIEGEKVFLVGHDWGAIIAWFMCAFRPDRVKAAVNLSVPFVPWDPRGNVVEALRNGYGEDNYIVRFQEPGEIEAMIAKMGISAFLKKWFAYKDPQPLYISKDNGFCYSPDDTPVTLPFWISEEDIEYYASKLEKTGITGGINYYRALPLNWELNAAWWGYKIKVPSMYIVGDLDWSLELFNKDYILGGGFKKDVPCLEEIVVMEGVGHFISQEKPDEINTYIVEFLKKF